MFLNYLDMTDPEQNCNDFWFGILTTLFIFLPACNLSSAFYGPSTAATLCSFWGDLLMFIGLFIWLGFSFTNSGAFFSWFLFLLGLSLVQLGSLGKEKVSRSGWTQRINEFISRIPQLLSFPIFILFSPLLIILTEILNIIMPTNKFIKNQKKCAGIR